MPDGVNCPARSRAVTEAQDNFSQRELAGCAGRPVRGIGCSGPVVQGLRCSAKGVRIASCRTGVGSTEMPCELWKCPSSGRMGNPAGASCSATGRHDSLLSFCLLLDQKSTSVKSFTWDRLDSVYG
jgi:hypothetical protein